MCILYKNAFCSHAEVGTLNDRGARMDKATILPPHEFLYEDASHCSPAENYFACSAVMPSLPLTIKWLRDCVKENPSLKVQVRLLSEMAVCSKSTAYWNDLGSIWVVEISVGQTTIENSSSTLV